jgi:hypothetical protein
LGSFTDTVTGYTSRGLPKGANYDFPNALVADGPGYAHVDYTAYNDLGEVSNTSFPAGAGLAAETVDTSYAEYGALKSMIAPTGLPGVPDRKLAVADYDIINQPLDLLSTNDTYALNRHYTWKETTGRPDMLLASTNGSGDSRADYLRLTYNYDKVGNPQRVQGRCRRLRARTFMALRGATTTTA